MRKGALHEELKKKNLFMKIVYFEVNILKRIASQGFF